MAMSAPSAPGGVASTQASKSVATTTIAPASWAAVMARRQSGIAPVDVGRLSSTPKQSPGDKSAAGEWSTTTSRPSGSARVRSTASVCGCTSWCTRKRVETAFEARLAMVIASAAAVASSSSEALASSMPVSSATIVW
jgi:hypothetical protein